MNNKLIIFDFFGVICSEIAPYVFENHYDRETAARLKSEFFIPADLGKIPMDELFVKMAEKIDISVDELKAEWDSYIAIDGELVKYIEQLREKYDIALLSNAPSGFVESLLNKFDLYRLFDNIVISSAVKIAKPDPEVYKLCVAKFNRNYEKIYMIDDNAANLKPLSSLGIIPIQYSSLQQLKDLFD